MYNFYALSKIAAASLSAQTSDIFSICIIALAIAASAWVVLCRRGK